MTPATIAAADDPRPRLCGMRLAHTISSPRGLLASRSSVARSERTTRLRALRATVAAPTPATSTVRPGSSVTRTTTSSYRPRARPSASKPGPRLALVAGTRTRTGAARNVDLWRAIRSALQPERVRGRGHVSGDGQRRGCTRDGPVRILQPVAGHGADNAGAGLQSATRMCLQQPRNTRGTGRLDKHAFLPRNAAISLEDELVGDRLDVTLGLIARSNCLFPRRGVADADGGGDGRRLRDR